MKIGRLSDTWLFETHSREELSSWVKQLKFFYFFRASGGHANDGDLFKASIKFSNKQDLAYKLSKMGISSSALPVGSKSASEQPLYQMINGNRCFVWVQGRSITVSVFGAEGDLYSVSEKDFQICKNIEKLFDQAEFQGQKSRNSERSICCISQEKYPELYE